MKSLLFRIFMFGLLLGILGSVSTMMLGFIIYYGVMVVDLVLPVSFLTYAAVSAMVIGVLCALASYIYVLILTRQFIKQIVETKL